MPSIFFPCFFNLFLTLNRLHFLFVSLYLLLNLAADMAVVRRLVIRRKDSFWNILTVIVVDGLLNIWFNIFPIQLCINIFIHVLNFLLLDILLSFIIYPISVFSHLMNLFLWLRLFIICYLLKLLAINNRMCWIPVFVAIFLFKQTSGSLCLSGSDQPNKRIFIK